MPRYFFNIRDGVPIIKDNIGVELPDLTAAIEEARREANLIVSGLRSQPELLKELKVNICDAQGNVIDYVNLPDPAEFKT